MRMGTSFASSDTPGTLSLASSCPVTTSNFIVGKKLGRRRTIWFAMGWILVGAVLQATAFNRGHLIVGRIGTGVGMGLKTSTVPMSVYFSIFEGAMCSSRRLQVPTKAL